LKPAFSSPPNVFDGVRLSGLASSELCRGLLESHRAETAMLGETLRVLRGEALEAQADAQRKQHEIEAQSLRLAQAQREAQAASAAMQLAEQQREAIQHRLDATLDSTSWRVTSPMRSASTQVRRLLSAIREGRIASGIKRRIKSVLRLCALAVTRHPTLKRGVVAALGLVPPLQRRLRTMLAPPPPPPLQTGPMPGSALSVMSPAARAVYQALMAAKERE
jgi:hypothetical protein